MAVPELDKKDTLDNWWINRPHLQLHDSAAPVEQQSEPLTLAKRVAMFEKGLIVDALTDTHGNQTKAARILGTTKRIIQYKIKKYHIDYIQYRD